MVIFSLLPNIRACDLLQDPLLDAIIPYFKDFTLTDTCLCLLTKITLPPLPLALIYSMIAEFELSKSTYSSYIAAHSSIGFGIYVCGCLYATASKYDGIGPA